ncbi:3-oxoacyl-ACP synthase III family protein [Nonomuraea fuscirosea]|uniref:3-oxoacyl-ACP synthase III family protein n=1 Tax=Nonomuraea fuscirosea TaxID=1291556 RepID=UPI003444E924
MKRNRERAAPANHHVAIAIAGTGACLPSTVVPNAVLSDRMQVAPEWIEERTGIRERRVAADGEATSDLATAAARRAMLHGFVYALAVARSMMLTNPRLRHALVIGADVCSRILDSTDSRTASLFGDGTGAVVLSRALAGLGITDIDLGADGAKAHYVREAGWPAARPTRHQR